MAQHRTRSTLRGDQEIPCCSVIRRFITDCATQKHWTNHIFWTSRMCLRFSSFQIYRPK